MKYAQALESFDSFLIQEVEKLYGDDNRLNESIKYSLLGKGKRVRGILPLATSLLYCGEIKRHGWYSGMAMEMIHCYSLIHDDLPSMDDDDFRRGRPSNHKVFGEDIAILAGDALLTDSFSFLSDHLSQYLPAKTCLEAISLLATSGGSRAMVLGQVLDMLQTGKDKHTSIAEIHHLKTGKLFSCSFLLGTLEANTQTKLLTKDLSKNFGVLFQVVDDYIDATKSYEDLGKTPGKDLQQGKSTYYQAYGPKRTLEIIGELESDCIEIVNAITKVSPCSRPELILELLTLVTGKVL
jgi:geranylgeranyl pyrophosphate synthase